MKRPIDFAEEADSFRFPLNLTRNEMKELEASDEELEELEGEAEINRRSPEYVRWVQTSLNRILGTRLPVGGVISRETRSAIRSFQQRARLTADGIVGPQTERALLAAGASLPPGTGAAPPPSVAAVAPSSTRKRFEEAVARNDWRQAFLNLNGLNMYEMLRSLDGLPNDRRSTLMQHRENFRGMVNMPRIEYATTVVQTRRLPSAAPGDLAATGQVQTAAEFLRTRQTQHVPQNARMAYVMRRLIQNYGFPQNGAAGLVGNLWAESNLLPNRVEGSSINTPMRAKNFNGQIVDFTAEQIMNRNSQRRQGPRLPGIGLAQWTTPSRRLGLFKHSYNGRQLGAAILFDMDAQIDYLVNELRTHYRPVYNLLISSNVTPEAASDEVLYSFEIPGSILGPPDPTSGRRKRLPRNDPRVQEVFRTRRTFAGHALNSYPQVAREAYV